VETVIAVPGDMLAGASLGEEGVEAVIVVPGDMLAGASLREEGVEAVVTHTDRLVTRHLPVRLDACKNIIYKDCLVRWIRLYQNFEKI